MAPPRDKDLTCVYWTENRCKFSDRACVYAHHHTGILGPKHRSKEARGRCSKSRIQPQAVTDTFTEPPAATTAGREARNSSRNKAYPTPERNLATGGNQAGQSGYTVPHGGFPAQAYDNFSSLPSEAQPSFTQTYINPSAIPNEAQPTPAHINVARGNFPRTGDEAGQSGYAAQQEGFPAHTRTNLPTLPSDAQRAPAHIDVAGAKLASSEYPVSQPGYAAAPQGFPAHTHMISSTLSVETHPNSAYSHGTGGAVAFSGYHADCSGRFAHFQGGIPVHPGAVSFNPPHGIQPTPDQLNASMLPASDTHQSQTETYARSGDWNNPYGYSYNAPQPSSRLISNLNPNAQVFHTTAVLGSNHQQQTLNSEALPLPTEALPETRLQNFSDLGIDVNSFEMESFDRKGKGRTLSKVGNGFRALMQGPASYATFEERANRYTPIIQRELDTCPPRAIEMPNTLWRLGIRLPAATLSKPLPAQIEELWTLRDNLNRNLKGSTAWVRLFNEDLAGLRMRNDAQAEAYAKWGEPFVRQSVAVDIPSWTLEMSRIEQAIIACFKNLQRLEEGA